MSLEGDALAVLVAAGVLPGFASGLVVPVVPVGPLVCADVDDVVVVCGLAVLPLEAVAGAVLPAGSGDAVGVLC